MTHFQGEMISGVGKPPILPIFGCYNSPFFFFIRNYDVHFCQNSSWTSVKTLTEDPVGPNSQKGPSTSSNEPQSRTFVKTLAMEPVGPDGENRPFSRSNEPQSISPSFLEIQNFDVIFAEIFYGHLLRP
ncbi:hypothetical protein H5410_052998 [Solanum commersonii]|uniref:Uncharacterized protein n=1 Tax=Solanum commersonii TaxID=4109 RepID=A0A9J5X2M1_SOLCO|nr:hypothetical protein H5410_052998 [Solanum commersonii]